MANFTSPFGVSETGRKILKVDIIKDAYSQLRISGITVDPTPNELELSLTRLEDMAAQWQSQDIDVGYYFEQEPDPNSDSGIQPAFKLAFSQNLATFLIPDFNKQVPQKLEMLAIGSFNNMLGRVSLATLNQVQPPNRMPVGSGNTKSWNRWFRFYRSKNVSFNSTQNKRLFIGDVDVYSFSFDSYLIDNEYIQSFDIQVDSGLELIDSSIDDDLNTITIKIKASSSNSELNSSSQVTCIITTNEDRVSTRKLYFSLIQRG